MTTIVKTLYDTDFNLWLEDTIAKLKDRDYQQVDWQHLIEEVEALGKSDRRKVRSYLRQLLMHLLKRQFLPLAQDYYHWETEIRNFRLELKEIFADSPSLRSYALEVFPQCWHLALESLQAEYKGFTFPNTCPYPVALDALLNEKFWEITD